jgi:hypothetical protein
MIVKKTLTTFFAVAEIFLVLSAHASTLTAADYFITSESIDSAGVKAQSANYTLRASAVGEFGVASTASSSSANYTLESGYAARLRDVIAPTSVVSRKLHGAAGNFDINLPLTGNAGIECRIGGVTNDYQILFTFPSAITFGSATVTPGIGGSASLAGPPIVTPDGTQVTLNLTNVSNAQRITVTLFGVNDGSNTADAGVQMGVLVGDSAGIGNSSVGASDIGFVKSKSGQTADATNFRADVTVNGSIGASDIGLVKSQSGTALPP